MSIVLTPTTVPTVTGVDFNRYDGYLDGQGVVYWSGQQASTQSLALKPVRQDVGNNPFETRPESGDIFSQGDFSHGMGQQYFHRQNRDPSAYYYSDGFDISKVGKLKHLHALASATSSANIGRMFTVGDSPFVIDGQTIKMGNGSFPGIWSSDWAGAGVNVNDACALGDKAYAAIASTTAPLYQRNNAGTWAVYQFSGTNITLGAAAATHILAYAGRLVVTTTTGIYEVVGDTATPTDMNTLPSGWSYAALWSTGSFVYASAVNPTSGECNIWYFGLDSSGVSLEAKSHTPMPQGHLVYAGTGTVANVVFAGGKRNDSGGYDPILFVAQPDTTGALNWAKVADEEGSGSNDLSVRALRDAGDAVLMGWSLTSSSRFGAAREGVARYDLGNAALSLHLRKTTPAATPNYVTDIMVYKGRTLISVHSDALYYEDLANYVPTATLISSVADWNNAGTKNWDRYEINHKPLIVGNSVAMYYSLKHPEENVWVLAGTSSVPGAEGNSVIITDQNSRIFTVKLVSTATSTTPEIIGFSVRSNPKPDHPEWSLTRYIDCFAKNKTGKGIINHQNPRAIRSQIQGMLYTWITLTEEGATWDVFVTGVGDITPDNPDFTMRQGQPLKEGYIVQVALQGTRL